MLGLLGNALVVQSSTVSPWLTQPGRDRDRHRVSAFGVGVEHDSCRSSSTSPLQKALSSSTLTPAWSMIEATSRLRVRTGPGSFVAVSRPTRFPKARSASLATGHAQLGRPATLECNHGGGRDQAS